MKKKIFALTIVTMMLLVGFISVEAAKPEGKGNDAPSGKHFNLNIIGAPKQKNDNFDGGNGARIFIERTGKTQFYVGTSNHFEVLDHDATDGVCGEAGKPGTPGIVFPYADGEWKVQIYVRLLGPKTSSVRWTTYVFEDIDYVQVAQFTLNKDKKFSLKTGDLLIDGFEDILWELDQKNDFRICQMRIYLEEA